MSVLIETTLGDIVVDLLTESRPRSCLNFLKLCKIKYYNFCLFHYVKRNYVAQTGDPTGTGNGGESVFRQIYGDQAKFFEAETNPRIKHTKFGTVSFINNGNNMHGSQFFITLDDDLDYLDGTHTVFGHIVEGEDVLQKINEAVCDDRYQPYRDIRINHTIVLDDPYDDPAGLEIPDRSPEPTSELLQSGRIGADEKLDETEGKSMEEIEDMAKDRKAKAESHILEMVGDIPDADMKPPENVLFVCKLNPVTSSEDLEIIFSRFGSIISCEVIRDTKTGDSLCYAFIEYENIEECEKAYFKMDNVLIDDRRIHVDFSQSVAKMKWDMFKKSKLLSNAAKQTDQTTVQLKNKYVEQNKYDYVFDDNNEDNHETRKHRRRSSSRERGHRQKQKHRDTSPKRTTSGKYDRREDSSRRERYEDDKKHRHRDRYSSHDDNDRRGKQSSHRNYESDRNWRSSDKGYSKDRDSHHRRRSPRR